MRVLLSAYACEPGKGSEPGVGWNWLRQIARYHDVWILTRKNNGTALESALRREPMSRVRLVYLDLPRWLTFWKNGQRGIRTYYYLWQAQAYFVARRLHREIGFDVVHHVTFVNYWIPTFLAVLPAPFVWGPVGGGESAPHSFLSSFSRRGRIYELLRNSARTIAHWDPFVRLAARRSVLALATTQETASKLRELRCRNIVVLSQVGLVDEEIRKLEIISKNQGTCFRLISIGNLLSWKGFHLGLRAFANFHAQFPETQYWLIGAGPERKRLERLARELGIHQSVTFWGEIPRSDVLEKLGECHVLVHPSLHDSGGWVCLEASAAGRPIVCLDLGGPACLVTNETGIKVRATAPEQVIDDLAAAFARLAAEPKLRARLGKAGQQHVKEHFDWEKKGDFLRRIYESVLAMPNAASLATGGEPAHRIVATQSRMNPSGRADADWKNDQPRRQVGGSYLKS
jgi:glycosyltransferase involved in cell wall biosynthesis